MLFITLPEVRHVEKRSLIVGLIIVLFLGGIVYTFFIREGSTTEVPPYVTGEMREMYLWSKTPEGASLLEKMPCYCGCKYSGHLHARHCFWRDDGTFDKHGITCSVCFDIAKKTKQMHEVGEDICTIRKTVDDFYEPNAHLGTETPIPEECL